MRFGCVSTEARFQSSELVGSEFKLNKNGAGMQPCSKTGKCRRLAVR